jgi:hypothetical protein
MLVEHHGTPGPDLARYGAVPTLTPLLGWHQQDVPVIVVLLDRTGADLLVVREQGRPFEVAVAGPDRRVSKSPVGSVHRTTVEHQVEEGWTRNARAVADRLEELVGETGARLVIVAGDEEALGRLRPILPASVARMVRTAHGSRASESAHPQDHLSAEVLHLIRSVAAEDTVAVLERFRTQLGEGERATEGIGPTVGALREARVETLLVHDAPADDDWSGACWFSESEPGLCALRAEELEDLGLDPLARGRSVDVAVRAALVTGASVREVPGHGGPAEGLGAILRWSETAT